MPSPPAAGAAGGTVVGAGVEGVDTMIESSNTTILAPSTRRVSSSVDVLGSTSTHFKRTKNTTTTTAATTAVATTAATTTAGGGTISRAVSFTPKTPPSTPPQARLDQALLTSNEVNFYEYTENDHFTLTDTILPPIETSIALSNQPLTLMDPDNTDTYSTYFNPSDDGSATHTVHTELHPPSPMSSPDLMIPNLEAVSPLPGLGGDRSGTGISAVAEDENIGFRASRGIAGGGGGLSRKDISGKALIGFFRGGKDASVYDIF